MKRRVLVITFEGLLSPVFQNQFVPALSALTGQYDISILSVEKQDAERLKLIAGERTRLSKRGIHSVSLPLLRVPFKLTLLLNVVLVLLYALVLVPVKKVELIHIRRYDAMIVALLLKAIYRVRIIFDPRGLFIEEKITAGKWRRRSFQARATRFLERIVMKVSDAIISFSTLHRNFLVDTYGQSVYDKLVLIPNCVDLSRFRPDPEQRGRRKSTDRLTLMYIGGASYWHMIDEMIYFFRCLKKRVPSYFIYLTYEERHSIAARFSEAGLGPGEYCIDSVPHTRIPEYLSSADAGIALIAPSLAKRVCAPIKFVEYLASGLPVVINQGIGDTEEVIRKHGVGVIYERSNIENNVAELISLLKSKDIRSRCRSVAERHYNLEIAISTLSEIYDCVICRS